jgi:disulfide bond formation protein DsbB
LTRLRQAKLLSFAVPAALLAGAYGSEIWGGLFPCEMCWWQRYAHFAALAAALFAFACARLPDRGRSFVWLAALAMLTSGGIGVYHAGVEADVFEGFTQCTAAARGSSADMLKSILDAPLVRCDEIQFEFLGVSMAGWNAIVSIGFALMILWLSATGSRRQA